MAGKTSANNGRLGGRPAGRKNDKTQMLEEEHKAFQQIVLEQLRPLVQSQLSIAKGTAHVYRIDIGPRGGRSDPALVTDPDELFDAIRAIDAGAGHGDIAEEGGGEDGTDITHRYYFITTKTPDGKAIDSLIDRVFGKSVQRIAGGDGGPVQIQGVEITFKK
jgi:hypothetical protein